MTPLALALMLVAPAEDQGTPAPREIVVTAQDAPNCPYRLIAVVSANVRDRSLFGTDKVDESRIYATLREKARKLGADAVLLVTYGQPHVTLTSWGSVPATGRAVIFLKPCPGFNAPPE